ncbi:helix-turn-helix transcriptional regulator [Streptomyces sp. NPDC049577]|uniref:helix-turn-helix domain-containing protein n=1 Tax=Streptomyces sp. NPDC049577 TaxID=3155153 RepID=UPI0034341A97
MANGGEARRFGQAKVGWEFFGSELKRCREGAGLTQQELGAKVFCSGSYIGQIEAALRKPQLELAERIDAELETDGFLARMCKRLIDSSPHVHYFAEVAYLEGLAISIREYAPIYVPGLLQTAAYARAVMLATRPTMPEEQLEERIAARLDRARSLTHPTEPMLWVVLDENVIRRPAGGSDVMHGQLTHIAEMAVRRRVIVQVLPFSSGAPALAGMLTLMTFEDSPPVAYAEGPRTGTLVDDPAAVAHLELSYDLVRAAALPPEASLRLIQSAAEEYAK